MTDLERVREYFAGNPWVTDIIDTHLKEDAAREERLIEWEKKAILHWSVREDLEAELTELRNLLYRATAPTASVQEAEDREAAIREGHERTRP